MPATKTRTRSAFQADDSFPSIIVNRQGSVAPAEDDKGYADTRYVSYVNAEHTIAVVSNYGSYAIVVKTDLTPEQVLHADSPILTQGGYASSRNQGVWVPIKDGLSNKTVTRRTADNLLAKVQDVLNPVVVSLDGKHAPALTIARKAWEDEHDYYVDRKRRDALHDLAKTTGLDADLLVLAVKEDRIVWSTPPVAPKQVMVVVLETLTGNLSERLVDEIVLSTNEVEGLGRIVHQGSVAEYFLARREREQRSAVREILEAKERLQKALQGIQERTERLLAQIAAGEVVGRGFHDTLNLARETETAQSAASAYAAAVQSAELPSEFALALRNGTFADPEQDGRFGSNYSEIRRANKALCALNGTEPDKDAYLY